MPPLLAQWYRRYKILTWIIVGAWALYTLIGFVVVPLVANHLLETKVTQTLQRQVSATSIRTNPYTFSMRLTELSIADVDNGPFVFINELRLNADPLTSLFKWGVVVNAIEVDGSQVHIERTQQDRFNFSDLIPPADKRPPQAQDDGAKPLRIVLKRIELIDGEVNFVDKAQGTPFETTLSGVNLILNDLDTHPDADAALYQINALSEADESVQVSGEADLDPLDVQAVIAVERLGISKYSPYYDDLFDARITEGTLGLKTNVRWSADQKTIGDIVLTLSQLRVTPANDAEALLVVPQLKLESASIDLKNQQVELGRITSHDGQIRALLSEAGTLNFQSAFAPPTQAKPVARPQKQNRAEGNPEWQIHLTALELKNYAVDYHDQQTRPNAQVRLQGIGLTVDDLSTQKDSVGQAHLDLDWADQGSIGLKGELGISPLQAKLDLVAEKMDLRPLQPYLNQHARLVITKGEFDAKGQLKLVPQESGLDVQYAGQAAINRFASVDAAAAGDFLKFKSLFLSDMEMGSAPFRLSINEVALTDFFNRLVIDAKGKSNISAIFSAPATAANNGVEATPAKTEEPPAQPASPPDIRIKTVTLQGGKVDFKDRYVTPVVHLPMQAIGGRISGLDALKTNKADVLLRGNLSNSVPLEITGKINPLISKPFIDLKLNLTGIDLTPFTPYSGKYLGHKLEKGQLSMQLNYLVADSKLSGQNKVQLNQLTLGETVPSPDATQLPIKLAIALLKDRNGDIDLDLPVSGDLEDPEFSVGGIVVKMFVNLIVNVATSPFKMLGAIFGGGEELAYLEFDPGQTVMMPEGSTRLANLSKILYERPNLKLEIQGQAHPEKDADGLRQLRLEQQLKAAKFKKILSRGNKAIPLEQIELTPEERETQVQRAFRAAKFPKPRNEKGKLKPLTSEEKEKLLYTAIEITPDDLRLLAQQRAVAAKDWLLTEGKVEPTRLFATEPQIANPSSKEEVAPQVKFNLK